MENAPVECYRPKQRGSGALKVMRVAHIARGHVDDDMRRYLKSAGFRVSLFPREVARDRSKWRGYIDRLKREKNGWEPGDVIVCYMGEMLIKEMIASGANCRRVLGMERKRGDKYDGEREKAA